MIMVTVIFTITTTFIIIFRYKAIMTPLAPRQSHGTLWTAIALIWVGGAVVALPSALYSTLYSSSRGYHYQHYHHQHHHHDHDYRGETLIACILVWPDGLQGQSIMDYG